jgi:hypothetical protein
MLVESWIPPQPKLGFVAEAPGDGEVNSAIRMQELGKQCRGPLVGPTGQRVHTPICEQLSIDRWAQYHANVFPFKLDGNKLKSICVDKDTMEKERDLGEWEEEVPLEWRPLVRRVGSTRSNEGYVPPSYWKHLGALYAEVARVNPKVLVLLGPTPTWALMGSPRTEGFRGHVVPSLVGVPAVVTYHPTSVFHNVSNKDVILAHYKVAWEAAGGTDTRPVVAPVVKVVQTLEDVHELLDALYRASETVSVDIETYWDKLERPRWWKEATKEELLACWPPINKRMEDHVLSIQFTPRRGTAYVVPFGATYWGDGAYWDEHDHLEVVWALTKWLQDPSQKKVFQRGQFDVFRLYEGWGVITKGWTEDTLIQRHVRRPGEPKDLDTQAADYVQVRAWKRNKGGKKED